MKKEKIALNMQIKKKRSKDRESERFIVSRRRKWELDWATYFTSNAGVKIESTRKGERHSVYSVCMCVCAIV